MKSKVQNVQQIRLRSWTQKTESIILMNNSVKILSSCKPQTKHLLSGISHNFQIYRVGQFSGSDHIITYLFAPLLPCRELTAFFRNRELQPWYGIAAPQAFYGVMSQKSFWNHNESNIAEFFTLDILISNLAFTLFLFLNEKSFGSIRIVHLTFYK